MFYSRNHQRSQQAGCGISHGCLFAMPGSPGCYRSANHPPSTKVHSTPVSLNSSVCWRFLNPRSITSSSFCGPASAPYRAHSFWEPCRCLKVCCLRYRLVASVKTSPFLSPVSYLCSRQGVVRAAGAAVAERPVQSHPRGGDCGGGSWGCASAAIAPLQGYGQEGDTQVLVNAGSRLSFLRGGKRAAMLSHAVLFDVIRKRMGLSCFLFWERKAKPADG